MMGIYLDSNNNHCLSGHEFEQTPGNGEGQGSLACCSPWGCRVRYNLGLNNDNFYLDMLFFLQLVYMLIILKLLVCLIILRKLYNCFLIKYVIALS